MLYKSFKLFTPCFVFFLMGCVSGVDEYYQPLEVPGAHITRGSCNGKSGIKDTIQGILGGIAYDIRSTRIEREEELVITKIHIVIEVPAEVDLLFSEKSVGLNIGETSQTLSLKNWYLWDYQKSIVAKHESKSILKGGANVSTDLFGRRINVPNRYMTTLEANVGNAHEFNLVIPDVVINGAAHSFPVLHFKKVKGASISVLNC